MSDHGDYGAGFAAGRLAAIEECARIAENAAADRSTRNEKSESIACSEIGVAIRELCQANTSTCGSSSSASPLQSGSAWRPIYEAKTIDGVKIMGGWHDGLGNIDMKVALVWRQGAWRSLWEQDTGRLGQWFPTHFKPLQIPSQFEERRSFHNEMPERADG